MEEFVRPPSVLQHEDHNIHKTEAAYSFDRFSNQTLGKVPNFDEISLSEMTQRHHYY